MKRIKTVNDQDEDKYFRAMLEKVHKGFFPVIQSLVQEPTKDANDETTQDS